MTRRGLKRFKEYFGHNPMTMANHLDCEEGMYWGNYRLTGVHELIYNLLLRFKHNENSVAISRGIGTSGETFAERI